MYHFMSYLQKIKYLFIFIIIIIIIMLLHVYLSILERQDKSKFCLTPSFKGLEMIREWIDGIFTKL